MSAERPGRPLLAVCGREIPNRLIFPSSPRPASFQNPPLLGRFHSILAQFEYSWQIPPSGQAPRGIALWRMADSFSSRLCRRKLVPVILRRRGPFARRSQRWPGRHYHLGVEVCAAPLPAARPLGPATAPTLVGVCPVAVWIFFTDCVGQLAFWSPSTLRALASEPHGALRISSKPC